MDFRHRTSALGSSLALHHTWRNNQQVPCKQGALLISAEIVQQQLHTLTSRCPPDPPHTSDEMGDYSGNREDVDLEAHPTAKKLVEKCAEFFDEVQNL